MPWRFTHQGLSTGKNVLETLQFVDGEGESRGEARQMVPPCGGIKNCTLQNDCAA